MKTTSILLLGTIIPDALAKNLRVKTSIAQDVSDGSFRCFYTVPMYRNDLITSNKCEEECEDEDTFTCSGYEFMEKEGCTLFVGKIIPDANRNLRKRARRLMPPSIYHLCKRKEDAELRVSASQFPCTSGYYIEKSRPNLKRCEKFCNNRHCNEYRYTDNLCTIYGVPKEKLMNAERREAKICEKSI